MNRPSVLKLRAHGTGSADRAARHGPSRRSPLTLGAGFRFRLERLNFDRLGADEAAHGAVDELGLSNEFAREPAVTVVEQGNMLLKAVELPLLRLDACFERIALGDKALKGARRIEQQAFDLPLWALPSCLHFSALHRFARHGDEPHAVPPSASLPRGAASNLQSTTIGSHVRFDKLAVKQEADLDQVRAHPQDVRPRVARCAGISQPDSSPLEMIIG